MQAHKIQDKSREAEGDGSSCFDDANVNSTKYVIRFWSPKGEVGIGQKEVAIEFLRTLVRLEDQRD